MRTRASRLLEGAIRLVRRIRYLHRRSVAFVVYAVSTCVAYSFAYLIRFEFSWPDQYTTTFLLSLPVLVLIRHGSHLAFRLTTSRWRYVGPPDVLRLAAASWMGSILFLLVSRGSVFPLIVPLSVIVLEGILSALVTGIVWIGYRAAFEALRYRRALGGREERRVLIVGAGESGYLLAREMLRGHTGYRPVGYVDDDPHKWGTRQAGLEVLGPVSQLRRIVEQHGVKELILAVPHATPAQLRVLVEHCEATQLVYQVLPSIAEVLAGDIRLDQIREVRIEDLLGREPVELELEELADDLRHGCALITGAAGSIGSELARQIALHSPGRLVLLDQAETDLYYLELELRARHPALDLAVVIADVADTAGVDSTFLAHLPTHVFHAAAYKHVPMMECNVREAVRNNVLGTRIVAEAAGRHGAVKFVLVSTDKAVRPVSVMGATKRLAELVTLELQIQFPETIYAAVRFGNVLGSNGSVIPVFKRQLAAGTPLTVTHPDVTRYFMTIPEAVQLILHSSLLPEIQGHIAMLEMGEPVRIVDLARNLLRLAGVRSRNGDRVVFTGLRPGEKLHEELVAPEEETLETAIPKVRLIRRSELAGRSLLATLVRWEEELADGSVDGVIDSLRAMFPGLSLALPGQATPHPRARLTSATGTERTTPRTP